MNVKRGEGRQERIHKMRTKIQVVSYFFFILNLRCAFCLYILFGSNKREREREREQLQDVQLTHVLKRCIFFTTKLK
jgi:hypothetical protein